MYKSTHENIYVVVRKIGSCGFQAVQAVRAAASYSTKYRPEYIFNVVLLEFEGTGSEFRELISRLDIIKYKLTYVRAYAKHNANCLLTAFAVESSSELHLKDFKLLMSDHRKKPDVL